MRFVPQLHGLKNYEEVIQNEKGKIDTTGRGLITRNIFNCVAILVSNGNTKYGMIHIEPEQANMAELILALRNETQAVEAVVVGANALKADDARSGEIFDALKGLAITDESKHKFLKDRENVTPGINKLHVGFIALSAITGEYTYGLIPDLEDDAPALPDRARRNSSSGKCVIL